jgi:hypothetical protein
MEESYHTLISGSFPEASWRYSASSQSGWMVNASDFEPHMSVIRSKISNHSSAKLEDCHYQYRVSIKILFAIFYSSI